MNVGVLPFFHGWANLRVCSKVRGKYMRPSIALEQHREAIRQIVSRHHVLNARVFGSVLKGEDKDDSDLDLLVDPLPGVTLFDLGGLQIELEEMMGVPVDLLTPGDLPASFRKQVLEEAKPV
jgi:predicted nucleotidyltransferase